LKILSFPRAWFSVNRWLCDPTCAWFAMQLAPQFLQILFFLRRLLDPLSVREISINIR
jgi:hypothetical protein